MNLRLSRMERYLHGPTPATSTRYTSSQDLIVATNNVSAEIDSWNPDLTHVYKMFTFSKRINFWRRKLHMLFLIFIVGHRQLAIGKLI